VVQTEPEEQRTLMESSRLLSGRFKGAEENDAVAEYSAFWIINGSVSQLS